MLSKVSWGDYTVIMGILVVSYYFYIGIRYYKKEISSLLNGKLQKKDKTIQKEKPKNTFKDSALSEAAFDELETVVNDLRFAVLEKAGKQVTKQELSDLLKRRLADYKGLKKPAFRVAINNYIITNSKEICGVVFSENDLNAVWDSLPR